MNVTIRPRKEGDQPMLEEYFKHPEVSAQLCMPWNAESWIPESRKGLESAYRFGILVDGRIAGITAIEYPTLPRDDYQVNFVLGRDYWEPGIATEALLQTLRFGFEELHLDGMFTTTESDNDITAGVLKAVGFRTMMVWNAHVLKDGRYLDLVHWTIPGGTDLPISTHVTTRQVRLERLPSSGHTSPIELFEDYPFTRDAPASDDYLATGPYYRFWGSDRYMPESKKKLERGYPFTILADGEIVGDIGLGDPTECRTTYEVGYAIGRPFWNRGICTEALRQVVRFAFDELQVHKVRGDTDAENPASIRALQKAGFVEEERYQAGLREDSWFAHTVYMCVFNPDDRLGGRIARDARSSRLIPPLLP